MEIATSIPVERFEETLTPILAEINKLPHVNFGGCGIVAFGIHSYVQENFPDLEAEIVFLFCSGDSDNKEAILDYKPASAGHVVVKVGKYYLDSEGIHSYSDLKSNWGVFASKSVNLALAKRCINDASWNPTFDRQKCVPKIGRILNRQQYMFEQISTIGA